MNHPEYVAGEHTGIAFPTTIEPMLANGTAFLTEAFRATGALDADNAVTDITESTEFYGGGMGRKLIFSLQYAKPADGLHTRLFAKFPRMFGDPLRELFAPLMQPEVRFARLSRRDGFPVAVPRCYFADYDPVTKSGLLITECIAYGEGGIEPLHEKCLDYTLGNSLEHYQALTRTMARLAGYQKSGKFGDFVDRQFPFDPDRIDTGARIPYTPEQLDGKLRKLQSFAAQCPQLFPPEVGAAAFLQKFASEAPVVLEHESTIRNYLNHQHEYIALCHWNMNLDNAWFWRDESGVLQAGLLDWGSVAQMNMAQALYGMTCAAETGFMNAHKRGLLQLFVDELRSNQGPSLDAAELNLQMQLAVAVLGIAWILDAPSLVERQIPDIRTVRNRFDPKLRDDFLARAQLQLLVVFLNEWLVDDIGATLRRFIASRR